jgi:hypothetical protein
MDKPRVVKGMPSVRISKAELALRLRERFYDPAFASVDNEIDRVIDVAWGAYDDYRKSPRTRQAGPGFAEPDYELPVEWLEARQAILDAQQRHDDAQAPSRVLIVNGSSRSDQTCPGEMSKSFRLVTLARETVEGEGGCEADVLDLSRLGVRARHLSLQGVRFDGDAPVSLAVLVLPEPRPRSNR